MAAAGHRAFCREARAFVDVDVGVANLCVVRAGELDLPLRCSRLLAAGAGVLQGTHFGRVADDREKGRCEEREKIHNIKNVP